MGIPESPLQRAAQTHLPEGGREQWLMDMEVDNLEVCPASLLPSVNALPPVPPTGR